ncbi:MAG: transposase [Pseudohongiellaceae bacterium]
MNENKQLLPLVAGKRRRRYSPSLKQEMVAATLSGSESVSQVARRYDINTNLLFRWRKQHLEGTLPVASTPALLPIEITDHGAPVTSSLELHFKRGARLIVHGDVDPAVLRIALEMLR